MKPSRSVDSAGRSASRTSAIGAIGRPKVAWIRPRSAAERWAMYVWRGSEADFDLRTLADWAAVAGLSYTSLCESCRILGIRPRYARDLARMVRAVSVAVSDRCRPEALLDVGDTRTLRRLLARAGLNRETPAIPVSVEDLLNSQQFVSLDNEGLRALRRLLAPQAGER